jgi:hypothetical protein
MLTNRVVPSWCERVFEIFYEKMSSGISDHSNRNHYGKEAGLIYGVEQAAGKSP